MAGSDTTVPGGSLPDGGATLAASPEGIAPRPMRGAATSDPPGYELRGEIGRGGMGIVQLWLDPHIGREVAAKVSLGEGDESHERFFHEARTQGGLAHPAIVPVHELKTLPDGRPYFTMQRVYGVTLASILAGRRVREAQSERRTLVPQFSTRKLLEALARIALAVEHAHREGVVHRDLKPANLMLGDLGEVYVLDWGIARRGAEPESARPRSTPPLPSPSLTAHGHLLGTPGYMSPEQARGAPVDARSDVYALGCILFEILAGVPLHDCERLQDVLLSTLESRADRSPARRAPDADVPPELDWLVLAATELDPKARMASARELAQGIERYLEGDRDAAARRAAADEHARVADAHAKIALGRGVTNEAAEEARRKALFEVGRAVALSPEHPEAIATLVRLLTDPPATLPAEVEGELDDLVSSHVRVGGRTGALAYGVAAVVFVLLLATGVIGWGHGAWLPAALFGVAAITSGAISRLPHPSTRHSVLMLVLSTVAISTLSTVFSPFFAVPTAICVNTMLFVLSNERWIRSRVVLIGPLGVLLPIAGELLGVTPPSYRVEHGTIVLLPRFMQFTQATVVVLIVSFVLTVLVAALALGPFRDDLDREQRRSRLLAWQLRQFVPRAKLGPTSEPPPR